MTGIARKHMVGLDKLGELNFDEYIQVVGPVKVKEKLLGVGKKGEVETDHYRNKYNVLKRSLDVVMDVELISKEDGCSVLHTLILDLKGTKFYGYHTLSKTHGKVFDGIQKAIIAFSEDKVKNSSMTQFVIAPLRERYEIH